MKQKIDITTWERKEHFNLFSQFDEPFWGICANVDVTAAYRKAKEKNYSFYLYYLHASLVAVNEIKNFRYRIVGDDVFLYEVIHATPTVGRNNNATYGIAFVPYKKDFEAFVTEANKATELVLQSTALFPDYKDVNVIHYSSVPWIQFTGLSHARHYKMQDSAPKISFGKCFDENGKKMMPVSVHGHHALIDGSHAGQYLQAFQEILNR